MGGKGGTMGDMMLVARGLRRPSLSTLLQDQHSPRLCHECCLSLALLQGFVRGEGTPQPQRRQ